MPLFVYIPSSVVSERALVDNERESSCKCYGQDCTIDMDACECIQKNGGDCAYTADGLLQDLVKAEVPEVLSSYSLYFVYQVCFNLHIQLTLYVAFEGLHVQVL